MVYFAANDGVSGNEVWKTDGTPEGTVRVTDINPGSFSSNPALLTNVGGSLFFTANSGGGEGTQLWRIDASGMPLRLTFPPGNSPVYLTGMNGILYFVLTDPATGTELWRSDGTQTGTFPLKDIVPGSGSSSPDTFTVAGNTLFFTANTPTTGRELWKTDGTPPGTVLVKDINPGTASGSPAWLRWGGEESSRAVARLAGDVEGMPRLLLRLEGAALAVGAVDMCHRIGGNWWLFASLILVPDISLLAYFSGTRPGAIAYNTFHVTLAPLVCAALGFLLPSFDLLSVALICGHMVRTARSGSG